MAAALSYNLRSTRPPIYSRGGFPVSFSLHRGRCSREDGMSARDDFMHHFLRHQADIKAFIGAVVLDEHLRADLFQEVALTLWQQIDAFDPSRSFGAWARGI